MPRFPYLSSFVFPAWRYYHWIDCERTYLSRAQDTERYPKQTMIELEDLPLAQSVSKADDGYEQGFDDEEPQDSHAALVDTVRGNGKEHRDALAYLLRYETMVRQQEAEDMATLSHIRPCVERLQELAGIENAQKSYATWSDTTADVLTDVVSFAQLKTALDNLECSTGTEFLATDRQLMMVLRMLTSKTTEMDADVKITWAEFLQCYKTCIVGMMTLQHLSSSDDRSRARDRTLSMLSLFEPPSTKLFNEDRHIDSRALTAERARRPGVPMPLQRRTLRSSKRSKQLVAGILLILASVAGLAFHISMSSGIQTNPLRSKIDTIGEQDNSPPPMMSPALPSSSFTTSPLVMPETANLKVENLPEATLAFATVDFFHPGSPDHYEPAVESMTFPVLVGGMVGLVGAPLAVTGLQILKTGLSAGSIVSSSIFVAGLASMASFSVRGFFAVLSKLLRKNV